MYRSALVTLIVMVTSPAYADNYVAWKPSDKAMTELFNRYRTTCPQAEDESFETWYRRCVPKEAMMSLFIPRVVDGNVIELAGEIVTLANVVAPSGMSPKCEREIKWSNSARASLNGMELRSLDILRIGKDPLGRISARLRTHEGKDLGEALIEAGFAVPANQPRPWVWCYGPE